MKPELQRIKIAEACGWKITHALTALGIDPADGLQERLPDYLNDLNEMTQAVKSLPYELLPTYMNHLFYVLIRVKGEAGVSDFDKHTAEPEYCAEAFLRTLNLWEE
jgi:hypothetical protein